MKDKELKELVAQLEEEGVIDKDETWQHKEWTARVIHKMQELNEEESKSQREV